MALFFTVILLIARAFGPKVCIAVLLLLISFTVWIEYTEVRDPIFAHLLQEVGLTTILQERLFFYNPFVVGIVGVSLIGSRFDAARRTLAGLCVNCRYDLRGCTQSEIMQCPECGQPNVRSTST